ncbi:DUF4194 domain-containing protein [Glutamicibacter sp. JL.03c]|uniref:DUF4194 domain-containing protein n=1 Tax=Glutamicibacter sp. JL.03c TaxID=2984842 RepID=UPI0021F7DC43|nr:DUF4194 domain-containing protein [Glutamicibacter sp. JL.03c]UYQ78161.1 DUF4194 domain-containing protein [Glutamicibacter sp. JL.03c]
MTTSDAYAAPIAEPLFEGDTGKYSLQLRQLLVRLLRGPYLDGSIDAAAWQLLLDQQQTITDYFSEIFLSLSLDMDRKIAMLAPVHIEQVHTAPIAPRRPLKRDETLLALRLRLLLEQQSGSGADAVASRSTMHEILAEHRQASDRDDKRFAESCDAAIARLQSLRLLTGTELENEFRISPALAMALPLGNIQDIPRYIAAIDANEPALNLAADENDELAEQTPELVQE